MLGICFYWDVVYEASFQASFKKEYDVKVSTKILWKKAALPDSTVTDS
jgi:hypothetical protein